VQCRLLLDVVVAQGATILQLLTSEDQSLLIRWDTLFVLNLALHGLNSVAGLYIKGDGLASQGLDENLHTTSESEHQVQSRLLLDVVVAQGATILQLLTSEDQSLLIRWDALLVLNLALHGLNSVARLYIKGDGLASQGLDENLQGEQDSKNITQIRHAQYASTTQRQDQAHSATSYQKLVRRDQERP
jgi:hypothetical protein